MLQMWRNVHRQHPLSAAEIASAASWMQVHISLQQLAFRLVFWLLRWETGIEMLLHHIGLAGATCNLPLMGILRQFRLFRGRVLDPGPDLLR